MIKIKTYNVCVIGATGLVGRVLVEELIKKNFPLGKFVLCSSDSSVGKELEVLDRKFVLKPLDENIFRDMDFAFFCTAASVSQKWVVVAKEAGCIVIDNSSYFRMDKNCSLIVPEVNFNDLDLSNIIANPNCSTIQSVICLNALKKYGLKKVIYNTYQSISGSGNKALTDKENFYQWDINKTCIPKIDDITANGNTLEEMKMINETKKILNLPSLEVIATCIRVPVDFSHGVSIVVELENEISLSELGEALRMHEGIILTDYPTTIQSTGNDGVYVGRIRKDLFNSKTLMFYCVADNIRRGAASNAVLIALKIIENYIAYKK